MLARCGISESLSKGVMVIPSLQKPYLH